MITESEIAAPPSIAVGFLCQRSVFGCATKPKRRASARTKKVRTSAKQKDVATARIVRGLKGIGVTKNYATKRHKKHKRVALNWIYSVILCVSLRSSAFPCVE